ncbi:MAG: hypothetical protein IPH98_08525 [Saprospiraceae bacterium]|nr:hypothetical protein [Candidatus Defluviibacterium haderslevense]
MDLKIDLQIKNQPMVWSISAKKMLDRMEFDEILSALNLPETGSNRGYHPHQLIKQFITSVWCGANKFEHTEVTRQDEVIRQFWGLIKWLAINHFSDFFKFDLSKNQQIFTPLYQWF